jgi:hypothetical protein
MTAFVLSPNIEICRHFSAASASNIDNRPNFQEEMMQVIGGR